MRCPTSATTARRKSFIDVTYRSNQPVAAAAVVRAVIDSYLSFFRETHKGTAGELKKRGLRADVVPRTRTDFKLPSALYASNLENFGVDIPPADLAKMAHRAFDEIQKEMQTIAAAIGRALREAAGARP